MGPFTTSLNLLHTSIKSKPFTSLAILGTTECILNIVQQTDWQNGDNSKSFASVLDCRVMTISELMYSCLCVAYLPFYLFRFVILGRKKNEMERVPWSDSSKSAVK